MKNKNKQVSERNTKLKKICNRGLTLKYFKYVKLNYIISDKNSNVDVIELEKM